MRQPWVGGLLSVAARRMVPLPPIPPVPPPAGSDEAVDVADHHAQGADGKDDGTRRKYDAAEAGANVSRPHHKEGPCDGENGVFHGGEMGEGTDLAVDYKKCLRPSIAIGSALGERRFCFQEPVVIDRCKQGEGDG